MPHPTVAHHVTLRRTRPGASPHLSCAFHLLTANHNTGLRNRLAAKPYIMLYSSNIPTRRRIMPVASCLPLATSPPLTTSRLPPPAYHLPPPQARNIMLKSSGTEGRGVVAKVADFGLSTRMEHAETHLSSCFQGTLTHMA